MVVLGSIKKQTGQTMMVKDPDKSRSPLAEKIEPKI